MTPPNSQPSEKPQKSQKNKSSNADIEYYSVRTSQETFESAKIEAWITNQLSADDTVLNACCGLTTLDTTATVIRNDKNKYRKHKHKPNEKIHADYHVDVRDLDTVLSKQFDVIIFDPPYSTAKAKTCYDSPEESLYTEDVINTLKNLLKEGGKLITFSYAAQLHDNFSTDNITVWQRIGRGKDYISTTQTKNTDTDSFTEISQSVPYNQAIDGVTSDVTVGGNNGSDIDITITNTAAIDAPLKEIHTQKIMEQAIGKTIIITDTDKEYRNYTSLYDNIAIIGCVEDINADYHLDTRTLPELFPPDYFDSAIIDVNPHDAFCWQTYAPSIDPTGKSGYLTVIKRNLNEIVNKRSHGQITQVGHTVTNMPSELGYTRKKCTVLHVPNATVNPLIVTDVADATERNNTQTDTDNTANKFTHWNKREEGYLENPEQSTRYRTASGGSYLHPAYGVDCPECSARNGSYCIEDTDIIHTPHAERVKESRVATTSSITVPNIHDDFGVVKAKTDPARPQSAGGQKDTIPNKSSRTNKNRSLTDFI